VFRNPRSDGGQSPGLSASCFSQTSGLPYAVARKRVMCPGNAWYIGNPIGADHSKPPAAFPYFAVSGCAKNSFSTTAFSPTARIPLSALSASFAYVANTPGLDNFTQFGSASHPTNLLAFSTDKHAFAVENVPANRSTTVSPGLEYCSTNSRISATFFCSGRRNVLLPSEITFTRSEAGMRGISSMTFVHAL